MFKILPHNRTLLTPDKGGDNGNTGSSLLLSDKQRQIEALKHTCTEVKTEEFIQFAKPLNLDLLTEKNGRCQRTFPLSNGSNVGSAIGLGLSNEITLACLKEIYYIKENTFRLKLSTNKDSKEIISEILVDNEGVTVLKQTKNLATEIQKGLCLDRYVSHLLASAEINAEIDKKYQVSRR